MHACSCSCLVRRRLLSSSDRPFESSRVSASRDDPSIIPATAASCNHACNHACLLPPFPSLPLVLTFPYVRFWAPPPLPLPVSIYLSSQCFLSLTVHAFRQVDGDGDGQGDAATCMHAILHASWCRNWQVSSALTCRFSCVSPPPLPCLPTPHPPSSVFNSLAIPSHLVV